MPHLRHQRWVLYCLLWIGWSLVGVASAQVPLPLPGGDQQNKDAPDVRLADDPRQQVERERKALQEAQQRLVVKGQEESLWIQRVKALGERRKALVSRRQKLILAEPPTEEARQWTPPTDDDIEQVAQDLTPDVGVPDAGLPDGGALDAGVDGGADAGPAPDAAPLDAGLAPVDLDAGLAGDADLAEAGLIAPELIPDSSIPDLALPDAEPPDAGRMVYYLPVLDAPGGGYLAAGVHPAELEEIDRLLEVIRRLEGIYAQMRRVISEERTLITEGINRADALLRQMEANPDPSKVIDVEEEKKLFTLKEVEMQALDVHLARIEVSLARAKQRRGSGGGDGDQDDLVIPSLPEQPPITDLEGEDIEPSEAFTRSHARAISTRDDQLPMRRELLEQASKLSAHLEPLRRIRARRARLNLMTAERALAEQESQLKHRLDHMDFGDGTLEYAANIHNRSMDLRQKNIPELEEELDRLRSQVADGDNSSPFAKARVLELQRTEVDEKLHFEREKLLRDTFRFEMVKALQQVVSGRKIPEEFLSRFSGIIDREEMRRRQREREARCDGWRRAQNSDSKQKATGDELKSNKKSLVSAYEGLADVCMRMEWVQNTEERLGDIARYHFERLAWQARGVWWYSWRTLLTLMILGLTVYLTRWVMRITHWVAGTHTLTDGAPTHPQGPAGYGAHNPEATSPLLSQEMAVPQINQLRKDEMSPMAYWLRSRWPRLRSAIGLLAYLAGIGGLWLTAGVLTAEFVWLLPVEMSSLLKWATHPIFMVGENEVSLWSMAQLAVWTVAAVWIGRLLQVFISDHLLEHFAVDRGLRDAVGTISRYVVVALGISLGLAAVGIGLGALAVVFGVIGIGIGFGLQNIASNFISGFILLLERPIRKGDFVQVDDMVGEVKSISARATIIETRDAVTVIVPNSEFVTNRVVNWTLGSGERVRAQVHVGVAYGSDVPLVRRLLLQAARAHPGVLKSPRPWVEMRGFGDSSLDFVLHVWTRRIRALPGLISDLRQSVDTLFREHDVEIPFPQRDIHVRSTVAPPGMAPPPAIAEGPAQLETEPEDEAEAPTEPTAAAPELPEPASTDEAEPASTSEPKAIVKIEKKTRPRRKRKLFQGNKKKPG